jgi:hypothetical protein
MLSTLLALGFIVLVIAVFGFIIYTNQKEKQQRIEIAQMLGFTPVETPDDGLLGRLASVHISHARTNYHLRNVMRKSIPYGAMYIYDMWNSAGKSSSTVENSAVAVISPDLNLPFFVIYPRLATSGMLANLANQFIEGVLATQGLTEVDFPDIPEMDEKFFVAGEDEYAVQTLFTPVLANLLTSKPMVGICAKGDTLSVSLTNNRSISPDVDAMRELVGHATAIHDCIARFS